MNKESNVVLLRLEQKDDYREVENITREAFWNIYQPGCEEHLLLHKLRSVNSFIKELDFIASYDDKIIGNIVYTSNNIYGTNGLKHTVITFGPISVLPEYQNKGIGSMLINHTALLAKEMGYKAIVIFGDPDYYTRFGFKPSKEYNITNAEGKYPAAMLVLELYPESLINISGSYGDEVYNIITTSDELEEFDRQFPAKEKAHTQSQVKFMEMVNSFL